MAPPGNSSAVGGVSLDTSGAVVLITAEDHASVATRVVRWSDLSPFAQGYVEAMFADFESEFPPRFERHRLRFSDLAPSTLAAILKDCEAFVAAYDEVPTATSGRITWANRQRGCFAPLSPPLTVSLNDAGQVVIGGEQGASVASRGGSPASPVKSDSAEGH